jgi:simple sugar transport system ATP-binding protein
VSGAPASESPPDALALEAVSKRYGALSALADVTLRVGPGTVHGVLGENGAGKTTLMRVAFGLVRPDAGAVRVFGEDRQFASPADAIAAGVGMVHQHFTLVPAMTVAENVALGGRGAYRPREAAERVRAVGADTGLVLDPAARAGGLPVAAQQRLEIVKALARAARVLILDEPGAVLTPAESDDVLRWLRRWVDAGGHATPRAAVLVTHKLRDALRHTDDVTVLRRGARVLTSSVRHQHDSKSQVDEGRLAGAMLGDGVATYDDGTGDPLPASAPRGSTGAATRSGATTGATRAVVVQADNLTLVDDRGVPRVRDASFALRAGEVVGVAAVEGSGQRELLRALAGRLTPTSGALVQPGDVAFVPEDRHRDALLLQAPLAENLALRGAGARRGRMRWPTFAERALELAAAFDVRGAVDARTPADALSGGNQQKFVVARELAGADAPPSLVVAENPTRGLDIRATAAVRARLRAARDAGACVVVHSSDLDEVLALADRMLVVHDGRVSEVPPERDAVGRVMLGAAVA